MDTTIILDKRKKNKEGFPIKIYFKFKNQAIYIGTKVEVELDQFENGEIINRKDSKQLNKIIRYKQQNIDVKLYDLEKANKLYSYTPQKLKQHLEGKEENIVNSDLLFKPYFLEYGGRLKGRKTYYNTISKLSKFINVDELKFSDINKAWLTNMESKLLNNGLSINTVGIYFRNIRAVFNDAIDNELVDINIYPFRRFKIKSKKTSHRDMLVEDLIHFRDAECSPSLERYRDIFMLSFYLRGLNLIDIVHLKHEDVHNGFIIGGRSKTNVPYDIRIEPEAKVILDKYKGEKYLINPMDTRNNYDNFLRYLDKMLKTVGMEKKGKKIVKQPFDYISIYWARHTWATLAGELDIPEKIISIGLQHSYDQSIVDIYVRRNINKVHEANRKILDYVKDYVIL